MDLACRGLSSHVDIQTLTPELTRSVVHASITSQGHTIVVENVSQYRFLDPSCGSLRPGQAMPVQ